MEESHSSDQELQFQQDEYRILTDPQQYLTWCKSVKKIKIMDQPNPLDPHIYLKDISLHKKGPLQDKMYARCKMFYYNIRRGNTLCQLYNKQNQPIDLFFCRRGMMKFYDLAPEYLQSSAKLTYQHALVRRIIFEEVDRSINSGETQLHLYSLFKENGEHCQVGYCGRLQRWLMASKNVTILVRDEGDLERYQKERFYWAKLIAKQFLKQIEGLDQGQVEQMKKELEGRTLIGEYCGYEKHQHITKYSEIEIIYYAIVENAGTTRCLPVEEAFRFFDKYKMKKVRTTIIKGIRKQNELYQNIYDLMKKTAMGTMAEQGQGSVLYIVEENNKTKQQTVISLCKLKTTEYLICRKLREMLKILLHKKGATANTLEKFKFEMQQIVKSLFDPPKPLSYYTKLAEMAFSEVETRMADMEESELRYRFVSFLENVEKNPELMKQISGESEKSLEPLPGIGKSSVNRVVIVCLPKTFQPNFEKNLKETDIKIDDTYRQCMESKKNVSIVHMVPRITDPVKNSNVHFVICLYSNDQKMSIISKLNKQKEPYNQTVISFVKTPDKEKTLDLLLSKIKAFVSLCEQKKLNYEVIEGLDKSAGLVERIQSILNKNSSQELTLTPKLNFRYFIIPLLLPGSGKTTLCDLSKDFILPTRVLSADSIRKEIYQKIRKSQPDKTFTPDQLFKMANKECKEIFHQRLKEILQEPVKENQIIYIDRIFVPGTLDQHLEQIIKNNQSRLVFLTQDSQPWRVAQYQYPFSVTYFLNCFRRSIQRQNHQSLATDQISTLRVLLKFYQMYRNFKFNPLQKRYPTSRTIKLKLIDQSKQDDKSIRQTIKNKLRDCLRTVTPGYDANDSTSYSQFIDVYYTYEQQLELKNPKLSTLLEQFNSQFRSVLR